MPPRGEGYAKTPARRGEECFVEPAEQDHAFVGTGGRHSQVSHDLVRGVTLVDKDGKKTGMSNPGPMMGQCPHGQNAMACLPCFHARSRPQPVVPAAQRTQPAVNPIIAAVKARAGELEVVPGVPPVSGPVHVGQNPDGTPVARKTKMVGTMPVPVQVQGGGAQAPGRSTEAFDYGQNQGRTDSRGIWHPPKHRSLIDSKPSHPNAKDPPLR